MKNKPLEKIAVYFLLTSTGFGTFKSEYNLSRSCLISSNGPVLLFFKKKESK